MRSIVSMDPCTEAEDREAMETAARREVRETAVRRVREIVVRARETADRRGEDPCSSHGR